MSDRTIDVPPSMIEPPMPEGATVNVPLKLAERAQARPDLVEVVFDQSLAGTYMEVAAYNAFIAAEASVWPRAWLAEITLRAILPDGNVVEFTSPASWSPLGFLRPPELWTTRPLVESGDL